MAIDPQTPTLQDPFANQASFWDALRTPPQPRTELYFWQYLCPPAKQCLEVGCGTGYILLNLLERGVNIAGLDVSPSMLDRLQLKANALNLQPRLTLGDARYAHLPDVFDVIFFSHRSFHHLTTPDDQLAALALCLRHLSPSGVLAIECFNPSVGWLSRFDGQRRRLPQPILSGNPPTPLLRYQEATYLSETQILNWTDIIEQDDPSTSRCINVWRWTHPLKITFRHELDHLLARAGFRVSARYGHHDRSPITSSSPLMIFVAEPI